jgi:nucleotide-binding universal stress UspA family protein
MALKELVVHLNQAENVDIRLKLAIDLARRHASHLTALFVEEWNDIQSGARATAEMGLADARALDTLEDAVATEIGHAASRLKHELDTACRESALDAEWRQRRGSSITVIRQLLPYTDFCVLGHEGLSSITPSDSAFCESVLMSTGAPIVFVPRSVSVCTLASRIVVAWDASRAALRALNDAMDLIERADHTIVLNVNTGLHMQTQQAPQQLTERLSRHAGSVEYVQLEAPVEAIAGVLHAKAQELGADLIVCGAFGHSRLRENLFGGVTRGLLDHTRLPLLLSH